MASQKVKILLVENEVLLAQDMKIRLSPTSDVMGIAASVSEALNLLEALDQVDLLLVDISLDGQRDGIDLGAIINEKYQVPFIFLTSHDDKATVDRAKAVSPSAFLLKPFNDREVSIAIELALHNFANKPSHPELIKKQAFKKEENQVLSMGNYLFLKKEQHFQRVELQDISFLEADNNYTTVHTRADEFIYSTVLKKMEAKLPNHQFIRVHRSFVINIEAVDGFEGNMLFIKEKRIPVSKPYREVVFKYFNAL